MRQSYFYQQHCNYIASDVLTLFLSAGGLRTTDLSIAVVIGIWLYTFSTFGVIAEEELADSSEPVTFNPGFFKIIVFGFGKNALGSGSMGGGGRKYALGAGGAGGGDGGPNCVIGGRKY